MHKIDAVNWISAARTCAPQSRPNYTSAMATPRAGFSDALRQAQDNRN